MILLTAPSQQIVLVLLKHFTLIWTDCKTDTLYKSVKCPVNELCLPGYICTKIIKLKQIDRIVSSYQIHVTLIKPNKFYLDFAPTNKEFQSNVNNESWNTCTCLHNSIYLNVDTQWKMYIWVKVYIILVHVLLPSLKK